MPKIKTHSGAKKRFSVTGSGKVKFQRGAAYADDTNIKNVKALIPYK